MVAREYEGNHFTRLEVASGISIEIKEGTLTNTGATVIITDKSEKKNRYNDWYTIYKKGIGRWINLSSGKVWSSRSYITDENGRLELDCKWEYGYGKLKKGTYRLVQGVEMAEDNSNKIVYVEFQIK